MSANQKRTTRPKTTKFCVEENRSFRDKNGVSRVIHGRRATRFTDLCWFHLRDARLSGIRKSAQ